MTRKRNRNIPNFRLPRSVGDLLCRIGLHSDELKEQTFDFGGASVAKYRCRRCGRVASRSR